MVFLYFQPILFILLHGFTYAPLSFYPNCFNPVCFFYCHIFLIECICIAYSIIFYSFLFQYILNIGFDRYLDFYFSKVYTQNNDAMLF